jgi:hypothetical protein
VLSNPIKNINIYIYIYKKNLEEIYIIVILHVNNPLVTNNCSNTLSTILCHYFTHESHFLIEYKQNLLITTLDKYHSQHFI